MCVSKEGRKCISFACGHVSVTLLVSCLYAVYGLQIHTMKWTGSVGATLLLCVPQEEGRSCTEKSGFFFPRLLFDFLLLFW